MSGRYVAGGRQEEVGRRREVGKMESTYWFAVRKVVYGLFLPLRCAFFARKQAGSGCFCRGLRDWAGGWEKKCVCLECGLSASCKLF